MISHVSIVVPFSLGLGLAYFLYEKFGPGHVDFLSFASFLGVSLSITAFPVLAKILKEKNMFGTTFGTLITACAGTDDISAWIILTAIVANIKSGPNLGFLYTILLTSVYIVDR